MSKLMICPKAKECKYPLYCGAREPHQKDVACGLKSKMAENPWKCPACVKVEPQQEARRIEILNKPGALNISEVRILHEQEQEKQCPECGHPMSEHRLGTVIQENRDILACYHDGCGSACPVPADLKLEPVKPTPTLREQMVEVLKPFINPFYVNKTTKVLDALESAVKAEWNRKLEEIAKGLQLQCWTSRQMSDAAERQYNADQAAILAERGKK